MKKFKVELSRNSWEYISDFIFECNEIKKDELDLNVVYADHVKIRFDEEVGDIIEIE